MYDVSGKNHLVVNQYHMVYYGYDCVRGITIYNVKNIRKENGIVHIYFYQDKTEPLIIDEKNIICIYKQKIDRSVIL